MAHNGVDSQGPTARRSLYLAPTNCTMAASYTVFRSTPNTRRGYRMIDPMPPTTHNGRYKHMRGCSLRKLFICFVLAFQALAPFGNHCFSDKPKSISQYHTNASSRILYLPPKATSSTQQSPELLLHRCRGQGAEKVRTVSLRCLKRSLFGIVNLDSSWTKSKGRRAQIFHT